MAVVFSLLTWATGCGGYRGVDLSWQGDLAWPEGDPRIRLQEVIELQDTYEDGQGKLMRWLRDSTRTRSFQRPYGVAWDDEALLIVDPDARAVARIDRGSRIEFAPQDLFVQPIGVAACWEGVAVSDPAQGKVALLGPDLRLIEWLAEDLDRPTGLACAGEELVVVETGGHRVLVLDRDGGQRTFGRRGNAPGEFNFPTSVAYHGGTLFVGDAMNFRVQRFRLSDGEFVGTFGTLGDAPGEMPRLKGIAVDPGGNLWVADAHLDQVAVFNGQGNLLICVGGKGDGPAEFSFPAGIAAHPDGRVAVVDSLNLRLKVFRVLQERHEGGS